MVSFWIILSCLEHTSQASDIDLLEEWITILEKIITKENKEWICRACSVLFRFLLDQDLVLHFQRVVNMMSKFESCTNKTLIQYLFLIQEYSEFMECYSSTTTIVSTILQMHQLKEEMHDFKVKYDLIVNNFSLFYKEFHLEQEFIITRSGVMERVQDDLF